VFAEEPTAFESAEATQYTRDGARYRSTSVLGKRPSGEYEWLTVDSEFNDDGATHQTGTILWDPREGLSDVAVSVASAGGPFLHVAWGIVDGGLGYIERSQVGSALPRPVSTTGRCLSVSPLRVSGDLAPELNGAVGVRYADHFEVRVPAPVGPVVSVGGPVGEAAWVDVAACGPSGGLVVTRDGGLELIRSGDAGAPFSLALGYVPGDLRLVKEASSTWLGWRSMSALDGGALDGGRASMLDLEQVCRGRDAGLVSLRRGLCPEGALVSGFDLQPTATLGPPDFVTECRDGDTNVLFYGERMTPLAYLPPRLVTREGSVVFSRFEGGQLTFGEGLLRQTALALSQPPDLVLRLDGGIVVFTDQDIFLYDEGAPQGVMLVEQRAWEGLPASLIEARGWVVGRTGVVVDTFGDGGILALPEVDWRNPSTYVLSEALDLDDGGTLVVATHDDAFDVAEVSPEEGTLSTRLRPSPAAPILSLALQKPEDGGAAEGYVVAGLDLFRVTAPTPRRWSASPVSLSGLRPIFTWFDHGRPRALMDDGTVLGLGTRVPLSEQLGDEVRAGAALCGAPMALTANGLYRLVPGEAGARAAWEPVPLPGGEATDFSRGRLLVGEGLLLVFASTGATWVIAPDGVDCAPP
jgi:hypothetical protein